MPLILKDKKIVLDLSEPTVLSSKFNKTHAIFWVDGVYWERMSPIHSRAEVFGQNVCMRIRYEGTKNRPVEPQSSF